MTTQTSEGNIGNKQPGIFELLFFIKDLRVVHVRNILEKVILALFLDKTTANPIAFHLTLT